MKIKKTEWLGFEAVEMEAGGYEALMVPAIGANMVKLDKEKEGVRILRTPSADEMDIFRSRPQVFGLPLLFPPNRIEDGTYTYKGKRYQYPITIPDQHNYHHGIIKSQPFSVSRMEEGFDYVEVEAVFVSNIEYNAIYVDFPHEFECRMTFKLSAKGLEHKVTFVNNSQLEMPLGIGYHTPIMVPFLEGGNSDDYKIRLSIGEKWELSGRTLPTQRLLALSPEEQTLREAGLKPLGHPIEWAFTDSPLCVGGREYHGAIITDAVHGRKVYYEVDPQFKHWTLWNNGGTVDWICPEPQSWAINAPNLDLPDELTGFQTLPSGGSWSAFSKLYVE